MMPSPRRPQAETRPVRHESPAIPFAPPGGWKHPDLVLHVSTEAASRNKARLVYRLRAADPYHSLENMPFRGRPFSGSTAAFCLRTLRSISDMSAAVLPQRLRSLGVRLAEELCPKGLREALLTLPQEVNTLQINSESEAWIPWELFYLRGPGSAQWFLGERFAVTRCLPDCTGTPLLPMRRLALVSPRYFSRERAQLECAALRNVLEPQCEVVEIAARREAIMGILAEGGFDALHFFGHAVTVSNDPDSWGLVLDDRSTLSPLDVAYDPRGLEASQPLVFLNACGTVANTESLTGIEGLAHSFMKEGAGAVIATYWETRDKSSVHFAQRFYQELLAETPLALATFRARMSTRRQSPQGSTWLSYTAFGLTSAAVPVGTEATTSLGPLEGPHASAVSPPQEPVVVAKRKPEPAADRHAEADPPPANRDSPAARKPEESIEAGSRRVHAKTGMELIYVPAGRYPWGHKPHRSPPAVERWILLDAFWIGRAPVTNREYAAFLEDSRYRPLPRFVDNPAYADLEQPVVGVSWHDAKAYCEWAGLELPWEEQWEAAARGHEAFAYPWGHANPTELHANFGNTHGAPSMVGKYPAGAGPFGTVDQAGNVWEWCANLWSVGLSHPRGAATDNAQLLRLRAVRGGSWSDPASAILTTVRQKAPSHRTYNHQGFRCLAPIGV